MPLSDQESREARLSARITRQLVKAGVPLDHDKVLERLSVLVREDLAGDAIDVEIETAVGSLKADMPGVFGAEPSWR